MIEDELSGLGVFGFERPDDHWLERIRLAETRDPLFRVGSFELLHEVGRGGQGIVYRARRDGTGRRVAIKRLLGGAVFGYASRERFARELAVTQSLDHPGIVKVLGMEVADGQPHLIMEWIDGVPVNVWSGDKARRRPVRDIMKLFVSIAQAVRHAHQRGVIHRDLKPSNILVDSEDQPHILDFGVAALNSGGPSDSDLTQTRQFLGTLAYASPEQLSRRRDIVDVRSDVYSLGVVLYEMLTGRLPHPRGQDPSEMLRRVAERDPPRPSSLNTEVDRDLDAISLKALAPDIEKRYQSVDAMQEDVQRWISHEPVLARAPDRLYRVQKFIKRHRTGVAFAISVIALIIAGGITATVLAIRLAGQYEAAEIARTREAEARRTAERVNAFLHGILASADPERAGGPVSVRDVLLAACERVDADLADDPRVAAAVHQSLGDACLSVAEHSQAAHHFQRARQIHEHLDPRNPLAIARSIRGLADVQTADGRLSEAEQLYQSALALHDSALDSDPASHAAVLAGLGRACHMQARYDEAEERYRQALELRQTHFGLEHRDTLESQTDLGALLMYQNRLDDAEALLRTTLDTQRRALRQGDMTIGGTLGHLSSVLRLREQYDAAEDALRESMAIYRESLGSDHPRLATAHTRLATIQTRTGRIEDAEQSLREALRIYQQHRNARDVAVVQHNLALLLYEQGQFARAEPEFRLALEALHSSLGPQHRDVGMCMNNLARAVEAQARFAEAVTTCQDALAILTNALPAGHSDIAAAQVTLSMSLIGAGRNAEAEQVARSAVESFSERLSPDHLWTACAESVWGEALTNLGRFDEAEPRLTRSAEIIRNAPGAGARRVRDVERRMAQFLRLSGRSGSTRCRPGIIAPQMRSSAAVWWIQSDRARIVVLGIQHSVRHRAGDQYEIATLRNCKACTANTKAALRVTRAAKNLSSEIGRCVSG